MKTTKRSKSVWIKRILATAALVLTISALSAQSPPHPNGGSGPGGSNTPVGGGAPLGGSLIILLTLGMGYGAKRVYEIRKKALE